MFLDTIWLEILAGNLFWRIGSFESNPPIFHHVSKEFCTPEVEEEHKEAKGNSNGVAYAVAVKTDVEIIVGNLLRQILAACSLFLRWSGTIVYEVTGLGQTSAELPKGGLIAFYVAASREKLRIGMQIIRLWSNSSTCTPQRLFSNLALFVRISHFARNIMAQALPNCQSKFSQIQKFQQSAKIRFCLNFRPYGINSCVNTLIH